MHIIDLDGYGYSAGVRGHGPNVTFFHYNLTAMLEQFQENIPSFLYGNSMGCMVINTFLLNNKGLKLQGVIFGSPFFEIHESMGVTWDKRILAKIIAPIFEVSFCPNIYYICAFCSGIRLIRTIVIAHSFAKHELSSQDSTVAQVNSLH